MESLRTFKDVLEFINRNYASYPAVSFVGEPPITYAQFYEKALSISAYLKKQNIKKGDHIAILSQSMPHWPIAYFAITSMGAVAVPILPDFHPNEIQHIIRHAQCKIVFVSRQLLPKIEDAKFEHVRNIILLDTLQPLDEKAGKDGIKDILDKGSKEITKITKAALKMLPKSEEELTGNDLAVIIYTSGTTGNSKGVMLSHYNIISNALAILKIVPGSTDDRLLSVLPLAHAYEATVGMISPLLSGCSIHYFAKPPTPRLLIDALQKVKPTIMLIVPLIIEKIYKTRILPELNKRWLLRTLQKIPKMRRLIHQKAGKKLLETFGGALRVMPIGGAMLAPDVETFLFEANFPYAVGYGLTETSPIVTTQAQGMLKLHSTGPALSGIRIKIHDPDPQTGVGEIWVKGPNVMQGYYKDPERTADVFSQDGWFKTGDLGVLDEDGYLFIKGRIKNVILGPSGENIYPEQIEAVLNEFDCIVESLVYEDHGHIVARVFLNYDELDKKFGINHLSETQVKEKVKELLETIRKKANEQLAAYSRISKLIEQTEPFEKTPTQKTKRYLYVTQN